jgi:uronate dehydrogenase
LIGPDAPNRPDSLYGASKCFGEAIARLFWDKFGIESAVIRIGSCQPRPKDARMLATWISEDDLAALFTRALLAPELGYRVIFGASDNSRSWWRNPEAEAIGWTPKDSADVFAASVADVAPAPHDRYQGGVFTRLLHFPPP